LSPLDWGIVVLVVAGVIALGAFTQRFMQSVADFLAAGRSAGRYLITISYGVANTGAITVLAFFEQNYEAGATLMWWESLLQLGLLVAMLTGWVIYRFRRTRCLTLAEFFERRYGRGFRIFAGVMAFVAGVLNFAIFPLVGSKFFVYFCGLPTEMALLGMTVPTYIPLMVLLLGIAIWFVFTGGQVSVIATDFAQGVFANVVFVIVAVFLLVTVSWPEVATVLAAGEPGHSRINPFDTASIQHFGILFFVISFIEVLYGTMSWQGEQAYFTSARTAHEARMGGILRLWFLQIRLAFFLIVPLVAFTILHSSGWADAQSLTQQTLSGIADPQDVGRLRVPVVLSFVLPAGLKGLMVAMMLAAFISTHNTYLHSWGSIFTQDVALPLLRSRGYRPGRRAHIWLLRGAVVMVALLAFGYSAFLYSPTEPIMLYLAITGAIFLGWSGTVIIGGLYWERGTTRAAWATAVLGSVFTLTSFLLSTRARRCAVLRVVRECGGRNSSGRLDRHPHARREGDPGPDHGALCHDLRRHLPAAEAALQSRCAAASRGVRDRRRGRSGRRQGFGTGAAAGLHARTHPARSLDGRRHRRVRGVLVPCFPGRKHLGTRPSRERRQPGRHDAGLAHLLEVAHLDHGRHGSRRDRRPRHRRDRRPEASAGTAAGGGAGRP